MRVQELEIRNLRVLSSVNFAPQPGLNVLYGPNGSGKTSVLEALHLLGIGRSFRSRRCGEMIRRGAKGFRVTAAISRSDSEHRIGIEHQADGLLIRCDGKPVIAASMLARVLPLVVLTPESYRLMTDGASLRRQLLDWCLFHVEPNFLSVFQRFRRALKQRNTALRRKESPLLVRSWDEELIGSGEAVHQLRARYISRVLPTLEAFVERLLPFHVKLEYRPGWQQSRSFESALSDSFWSDVERGYTQVGPQRCDLEFLLDGIAAKSLLSRGETKLFVAGLILAQAAHFVEAMAKRPIILVDEVASELDRESRYRVFSALATLGAQTFVTSVSRELAESGAWPPDAVFHVEQGEMRTVV